MAGHSKWSNIKHKKAKEDAKKAKAFTKLIKEITVAARQGGGDPEANPKLRLLLEKAKEVNMPQDNAVRAIKRGTGEMPGVSYESYLYEGYAPENVALMIEVLTDNKNRAVMELRTFFNKNGGVLAESGAVNWMFNKLGVIKVQGPSLTEDKLLDILLTHDVKDIEKEGNNTFRITTDPKALEQVKKALEISDIKVLSDDVEWVANNTVSPSKEQREKAEEFIDKLEELDDVQNVYSNLSISESE